MQKSLIVVQCRYASTRLRGKALYPLCGIPILAFLLRRLKNGLPSERYIIVLATTENKEDDIVEILGQDSDVTVIRGEQDDVLKRYMRCLGRYPADFVVRVTADNPLTCPEIIKGCVHAIRKNKVDYVQSQNHPRGVGVDVFTSHVLRAMDKEANELYEREHINAFVLKHPERFRIHHFQVQGETARPDLSMTVDTKQDWESVNALFTVEDKEPWRISLAKAIIRMDSSSSN